ncbi:MAG TPA: LysR substrate-binding domain-containing protein [Planctomycetota bacterium]|nr:LysR substrate-binding domain-containing protein [Planctomycetota bacterium]
MPVELRQLRYFVVLGEELHFRRSAERLHLAQPALSQAIKRLERALGTPLLERTTRNVVLTPAGEAFLPEARLAVFHADRAVAAAQRSSQASGATVRLGFVSALATAFAPLVARRFYERQPDGRLRLAELTKKAQLEALGTGELDVGLVYGDDASASNGFVSEVLRDEPLHVALPVGHRLAGRSSVRLEELAHEPWIAIAPESDADGRELLRSLAKRAGFEPLVIQEATNLHSCLGLVGAGLGIGLAPAVSVGERHEGVAFARISDAPSVQLHAVVAPGAPRTASIVVNVARELARSGWLTRGRAGR